MSRNYRDIPAALILAERLGDTILSEELRRQIRETEGRIPLELKDAASTLQYDTQKLANLYLAAGAALAKAKKYDFAKVCFIEVLLAISSSSPQIELLTCRFIAYVSNLLGQRNEEAAALRRATHALLNLECERTRFINTTSLAYELFDAGEEEEANDVMRLAKINPEILQMLDLVIKPEDLEKVTLRILTNG